MYVLPEPVWPYAKTVSFGPLSAGPREEGPVGSNGLRQTAESGVGLTQRDCQIVSVRRQRLVTERCCTHGPLCPSRPSPCPRSPAGSCGSCRQLGHRAPRRAWPLAATQPHAPSPPPNLHDTTEPLRPWASARMLGRTSERHKNTDPQARRSVGLENRGNGEPWSAPKTPSKTNCASACDRCATSACGPSLVSTSKSSPCSHDHCWHSWKNATQMPAMTMRLLTSPSGRTRTNTCSRVPPPR